MAGLWLGGDLEMLQKATEVSEADGNTNQKGTGVFYALYMVSYSMKTEWLRVLGRERTAFVVVSPEFLPRRVLCHLSSLPLLVYTSQCR